MEEATGCGGKSVTMKLSFLIPFKKPEIVTLV
jgi:hypothetical protein